MSKSTIVFLILGLTVAVFVWDRLPIGVVALAVASAAALLTPVATPANLMVLGPGGYRFGDDWKARPAADRALRRRRSGARSRDLVVLARALRGAIA